MPKINEILLILEVFQYATSLDLNMGYYHIQPSENASKLCMIITLWRKYHYKRLPIGIANYPKFSNIRQMIYLMDLNLSVCTYMEFCF